MGLNRLPEWFCLGIRSMEQPIMVVVQDLGLCLLLTPMAQVSLPSTALAAAMEARRSADWFCLGTPSLEPPFPGVVSTMARCSPSTLIALALLRCIASRVGATEPVRRLV